MIGRSFPEPTSNQSKLTLVHSHDLLELVASISLLSSCGEKFRKEKPVHVGFVLYLAKLLTSN